MLDLWLQVFTISSEQSCGGSNEGNGTWGQLGSCGLTAEDKKYRNHMCVTDVRRMHRRFSYSHHRFVLMSQSQRTIAVALSPMCAAHTFWALLTCVPYIQVT